MGFSANNIVVGKQTNNDIQEQSLAPSQLNTKELEIILSLIKRSTFLGEDIEILYNMIIKLQNQYIEQTKK
jgi:hypothetical protein